MAGMVISTEAWLLKSRQLAKVSRTLTNAMGVNDVMQFTVSEAALLLDSSRAVLLTSDANGLLTVRASIGISSDLTCQFASPLIEPLSPLCDTLLGISEQSFLGVPLVVGGQISGVLVVAREATSLTSEEQEFLLSALADQAAVAIEQVQLGEAAQFRERLIGIVSHDLRSPITAISLIAQSLLRKRKGDAFVTAAALRIQCSAERASRMIHDLLDYTQFHLGAGVQLHCTALRMAEVMTRSIDEAKQVHPDRQVIYSQHGDPKGEWDSDRLEQAIGNIISNAIAYSPKTSPICIKLTGEGSTVLVTVHNQGSPIEPKNLPHIFEPMQRGTTVSNSARSVGLGLYITKNIIEAHNGKISITSCVANGTTVRIQLIGKAD